MDDIIDVDKLLSIILNTSIDKQKAICELIDKELGNVAVTAKTESNLAALINILAAENLVESIDSPEIKAFSIESKITFNDLKKIRDDIHEYKIYHNRLDKIYSEFDKGGVNKSFSVLQAIRRQYKELRNSGDDADSIFNSIIDAVINIIANSINYKTIPDEELDHCVRILVVDAFIRCKIFENPKGYDHVITR